MRFFPSFWWVVGDDPETGKRVLKGSFGSQSDSVTASDGLIHVRTYQLNTRDRERAKAEIRAKLNEDGVSYGNVLQRIFSRPKAKKKPDELEAELEDGDEDL